MADTLRRPPPMMTVADFLDWPGDGSGRKFQLVDGEIRAMSPGSATHGTIQANLSRLIGNKLVDAGGHCRVVTEPAIATRVRASTNVRVPDLGVSCTADAPGQQMLPDPVLLIEVLSPGNSADTWDNVWSYTVNEGATRQPVARGDSGGRWPGVIG